MLDLSKPLLAQPELLLMLSDPELIKMVCRTAAVLGFFAALLRHASYPIRRPRSTNPVLLLGLALFVASAAGLVPIGASFLLVGAWACWGAGTMGGNAAAMCIPNVPPVAHMIRADILRAYRILLTVVDDLRDGTITLGDIGLALGRAATLVLVALAPVGVLAAINALVVVPFLDPKVDATRIWLILGGVSVAWVALALNLRWGGDSECSSPPLPTASACEARRTRCGEQGWFCAEARKLQACLVLNRALYIKAYRNGMGHAGCCGATP